MQKSRLATRRNGRFSTKASRCAKVMAFLLMILAYQPDAAAQAGDGWLIVSGVYYLKPSAQVTNLYAYCFDEAPPHNIIEYCNVSISVAYEADSGGHVHNSSRPKSSVDPTGGNTGTTGLAFTVATPRIGQQEWLQVCAAVCNQYYWIVGYPDLVDLPTASNILRVGDRPWHPSNHWMLPYVADALQELVTDYLAAWPVSGGQLALNDSALIFGGRFDISQNWTGYHYTHGRGTAQDVRGNCGPGSVPHNLPAQNAFIQMAVLKGALAPPISIQSEAASETCNGTSNEHHHVQFPSPSSPYNPPLAPGSPGAERVSNSQINLAWTDTSDNELAFVIERKIGAGGTWQPIVAVDPNIQGYADTGLDDGTAYYYRIFAVNDEGASTPTSPVFACTCTSVGSGSGVYFGTFANEISYGGYWVPDTNIYGWQMAWGAPNATTTFSFSGDSITWYYAANFYHGVASVFIDGKNVGDLDQYHPWSMVCIAKTWSDLGEGNHTIQIRVTGTSVPPASDAFIATLGFETNLAPLHESDSYGGADWYQGNGWSSTQANNPSVTSTVQDGARFNFVGNNIRYYHDAGPDRGWVTVTIDGINKGSFNHYNPDAVTGLYDNFTGLGPGKHTIVIQLWEGNPGGGNPSGTHSFTIQGFDVY